MTENFKPPRSVFRSNYQTVLSVTNKLWLVALQYRLSLVFWLIAPILMLLPTVIFGTILVGSRYSDNLLTLTGTADIWLFTGLGLAYLRFVFGTMWTAAFAIREEEFYGTLEAVYVTPPSKLSLVAGTTLYALTNNALTLVVQVIFLLMLLGKTSIEQILVASLVAVSSVLMIQGLAVMLSAVVLRYKQGWRIVFTIEVLISAITPSAFPIGVLPDTLRAISLWSPFTIGVIAFRDVLLFNDLDQWLAVMELLGFALLFFVMGWGFFNHQDRLLRMRGSLGKY